MSETVTAHAVRVGEKSQEPDGHAKGQANATVNVRPLLQVQTLSLGGRRPEPRRSLRVRRPRGLRRLDQTLGSPRASCSATCQGLRGRRLRFPQTVSTYSSAPQPPCHSLPEGASFLPSGPHSGRQLRLKAELPHRASCGSRCPLLRPAARCALRQFAAPSALGARRPGRTPYAARPFTQSPPGGLRVHSRAAHSVRQASSALQPLAIIPCLSLSLTLQMVACLAQCTKVR